MRVLGKEIKRFVPLWFEKEVQFLYGALRFEKKITGKLYSVENEFHANEAA